MLLDGYLPEWHPRERHRVPVAATPAAVLAALDEVTWAEAPVFGFLMSMRAGLTGRHRGGRAGRPVLEGFTGIGFAELIGRASCRERGVVSVCAISFKNKC